MKQPSFWRNLGWPVYLVSALLLLILGLFVYELATFDESPAPDAVAVSGVDLDLLLAEADSAHGEELVETYGCATCHVQGAVNGIAPPFDGLGGRAVSRVSGMSASAYIYDSIVRPTDYLVPGFAPSMPQDFEARMSPQELVDVVVYLLEQ